MRDVLVLSTDGVAVREFEISSRGVEIGRHPSCDIVVHDPAVAERMFYVSAKHGIVWIAKVLASSIGARRVLPRDLPLAIGERHTITRKDRTEDGDVSEHTVRDDRVVMPRRLTLVVERTGRRVPVDRALTIGTAADNDIVLHDKTMSRHHCRVEPTLGAVVVRDLGSRNGVWIAGARVDSKVQLTGGTFRAGRCELSVVEDDPESAFVVASRAMFAVQRKVDNASRLRWPVLIRGESGVGKEHVARGVHDRGSRKRGPFIALNAGGLPRHLIESELFGHERGAFTGAVGVHRGAFERADGGTLFLDEVGELPLELQARLLRVLETFKIRRVGGEREQAVDVRLVCATHRDLHAMVAEKLFREDLYYRIHQLPIEVPPLRRRLDDIEPLARHFLRESATTLGHRELAPDALAVLHAYSWPGNVRELRNVLRLALSETSGGVLYARDLHAALGPQPDGTADVLSLHEVVAKYDGNISAAARALGMARSTLRDRLKRAVAAE